MQLPKGRKMAPVIPNFWVWKRILQLSWVPEPQGEREQDAEALWSDFPMLSRGLVYYTAANEVRPGPRTFSNC